MKRFDEVKVGDVIYKSVGTTFRKYKVTDIDVLPFDDSLVICAKDCDTPNMYYFYEEDKFVVNDPKVSNVNNKYFTTFKEALKNIG